MSPRAAELLALARELPEEEQLTLAHQLLGDDDFEWTPELDRRANEALRGEHLVDFDAAIAELRTTLRSTP